MGGEFAGFRGQAGPHHGGFHLVAQMNQFGRAHHPGPEGAGAAAAVEAADAADFQIEGRGGDFA